jgi:hypothetical protein
MSMSLVPILAAGEAPLRPPRRFDFARDTFAFANQLHWEYLFDPVARTTSFRRRDPKPQYAHRCFVLTRAARQFLYHAHFDAAQKMAEDQTYRRLIRKIMVRNPRTRCPEKDRVTIPGYANLRQFSADREAPLKAACGGAWRSYVLRSHWRMVFPISRRHQSRTAARLAAAVRQNTSPIVHLVTFPALTINHGMILFDVSETEPAIEFQAYDPNDPSQPACLAFDRAASAFRLPPNRYWAGGPLNVIQIYCGWFL